jgi:chaperone modulatory protein CbpM
MGKKKLPEGLLNEENVFSLSEFSALCNAKELYITKMVEMGILEPEGRINNWRFSIFHLHRFKKARRLQTDLKLNLAGVALSLELLDELQQLREDIQNLEYRLRLINLNISSMKKI